MLLFGGKGGVGKTTCAVAAALKMAGERPNASFLLVSTDPAHSLEDSLDTVSVPKNLVVKELDSQACLKEFKRLHGAKLQAIASRGTFLDAEDISQLMDLSLPGMDELIAFLEISTWVDDGGYDCIVVDTAPAGHTLKLLELPVLIRRWLYALDALLAKHRYMKQLFTGSKERDELDLFLVQLATSVKRLELLLRDEERCLFVPVMLAETVVVQETLMFVRELEKREIYVPHIVVNMLYPENNCPTCSYTRFHQLKELNDGVAQFPGKTIWGIPIYPEEMRGGKALAHFWNNAEQLGEIKPLPQHEHALLATNVAHPAKLPADNIRFLIFAGKGGVGKTTMACATALRLTQGHQKKRVLLFSTDPAHSLSACLGQKVGGSPTLVRQGLYAMEVNADAEFAQLRLEYQDELSHFLHEVLPNLDITFDREVMERIMDLSPSGLDEIMALTLVMGFVNRNEYDMFIIDSAPTGHLIRLLEMPQLIDEWLKVFFGLLLKYKNVFRVPGISRRLVELSKAVKQLRKLLADPQKSSLYPVTISTMMAFEESKDLVAAVQRIGVHVPILFVNLLTPAGECALCKALHRRELHVTEQYKKEFLKIDQVLIFRQKAPCGIESLSELGNGLYGADSICLT